MSRLYLFVHKFNKTDLCVKLLVTKKQVKYLMFSIFLLLLEVGENTPIGLFKTLEETANILNKEYFKNYHQAL